MSSAIDWVAGRQGFDALADEWEGLLGDDAMPFDLHCWYSAWWEAFGAGRELTVCTARRDGVLRGVLPLFRDGLTLGALANAHTPVFRPVARDADTGRQLLGAAMGEAAGELIVPTLPSDWEAAVGRLRGDGMISGPALLEPGRVSPIVDTSGDFETWRKASKPRWGAPLERFRRKMTRDHEAEFVIVEAPADLAVELDDGFRVEASGWKGQAGTAILSSFETERFYRAVAQAFHGRDQLRLSRIVLDGETVGFDLCLLHRRRLYLLKTGFDERFRRFAPGLVMRLSIIERCFELGLGAHELLGDDSEWKRKFATGDRAHVDLRAYPRSPAGVSRYLYRAYLRPHLRDTYRRLRRRRR